VTPGDPKKELPEGEPAVSERKRYTVDGRNLVNNGIMVDCDIYKYISYIYV